jgi:predicted regulator of Ras-like GTPase activity (Roadblock/LC7/MglB family)
METILQGLQELEGVHGAIVVNGSGRLVAHRAHNLFDNALLQQVSQAIVTAIDAVKLTQEDWESITASFTEGKLLIRSLPPGEGGMAFFLALIADSRLNPSFATVAIRVAMGKLKAALQGGGAPAGVAMSSSSGALPMTRVGAGLSQLKAPITEVSNSGLSWSGFGDQSAMGSGIAVADPASAAWLTLCTKTLAKYVGPMAKLFVKEAVRKLCPDRPFSLDAAEALVSELAKNVAKPADVSNFRSTALKAL